MLSVKHYRIIILMKLYFPKVGEGIPVNACYIEYPFGGGSSEWALKCDSQTSTTMIYDCPTSKTYMRKSAASMCHDVH